jgi:hypothetical protein
LNEVQNNQDEAKYRAENAGRKALRYTWTSRAENILTKLVREYEDLRF